MYNKILKRIVIFISFIMLIDGIYVAINWLDKHGDLYINEDTFHEVLQNDLSIGCYVSFYIDGDAKEEIASQIDSDIPGDIKKYWDGNVEYEAYSILVEPKKDDNNALYMWIMVKDEDTRKKLKDPNVDKVYFQGDVIGTPSKFYESNWDIADMAFQQAEDVEDRSNLYRGIISIIIALIVYFVVGGVKACVPDVAISSKKYNEYSCEYGADAYNIENELLFEKDNLNKLQVEQAQNKIAGNALIVVFIVGLAIYLWIPVLLELTVLVTIFRIISLVLMFIGTGGIWSRFINSSHKLAVYTAYKREKRSIYLEIEKCKMNIEELERIMDTKNK